MEEVGLKLVAADGTTFTGTLKQAEAATDSFVKNTEQAGPKVSKAGEAIKGAFREIGALAVNAALEAGQALIKFGVDSIKVAGDFEAGMGKFSAVAGDISDTGLTIDDFRKKFLQLGKDTQFSAGEAQDAMTELVKGGVSVKDAYGDATQATLDLAAATKMDLAQSAEIVAKQLGVWGDKGLTATQAVNLLSAAADASTVNVDDLAQGLSQAGGTAKVAGVSYSDLVTTMAMIAPGFSSAADAGTSFKTFLSRLIPSTDAQTAAMVDLGLATADGKSAFYDAQGQFVGMEKAAEMLKNATAGLTEEQKLSYLQTIFGSDAIRAAAAISEGGAEGIQNMTAAMDKQGTAADKSATLNKGFNFAMEQLSGSLETLQIIIGSAVLPILTRLVNEIIVPAVNQVMAFAESFGGVSVSVEDTVFAFGELFGAGTTTFLVFEQIKSTIERVMREVEKVVGVVLKLIVKFWDENGEQIKADVDRIFLSVLRIISDVMGLINATIVPALKGIAKFISENGDDIIKLFKNVWTIISTVIDTVLTLIGGIIRTATKIFKGDFEGAWNEIKATVERVWNNIKIILATLLDQIKIQIGLTLTAIFGNVVARMDDIKGNIAAGWATIKSGIDTALGNIKTAISTGWDSMKQSIETALSGMLSSVTTSMGNIKDKIVQAIGDAIQGIKDKFSDYVQAGKDLIGKVGSGIADAASSVKTAIGNAISGALAFPDQLLKDIVAYGLNVASKIAQAIKDEAGRIVAAVTGAVADAVAAAKAAIEKFIKNPLGLPDPNGDGYPGNFKGAGAGSVSMPATASQHLSTTYAQNYSRTYQLTVNSGQSVGALSSDFTIMEALGR